MTVNTISYQDESLQEVTISSGLISGETTLSIKTNRSETSIVFSDMAELDLFMKRLQEARDEA